MSPGLTTRYFIGSAARTAEEYLRWVRGHWGFENSLHWVLDVCFREDDQRHWAGNSAENLGWLRKLALCLLKAEKSRSSKGKSINTRCVIAGWKNDDLLTALAQIPAEIWCLSNLLEGAFLDSRRVREHIRQFNPWPHRNRCSCAPVSLRLRATVHR